MDVDPPAVRRPDRVLLSGVGTWAFGGQVVVVEADVETGEAALLCCVAVHDYGRPINPMIVEGQLHGGPSRADQSRRWT